MSDKKPESTEDALLDAVETTVVVAVSVLGLVFAALCGTGPHKPKPRGILGLF